LNIAQPIPSNRRSFYYFFMVVGIVGYETTATACWALLFIVRAFSNDPVTVAVWTCFHVRLMGDATASAQYRTHALGVYDGQAFRRRLRSSSQV